MFRSLQRLSSGVSIQSFYIRKISNTKEDHLFTNVVTYGSRDKGSYEYNNTGLSKKMDGIWNRYNLKSTGRIYTFGVLKCSEEFKVLDLP